MCRHVCALVSTAPSQKHLLVGNLQVLAATEQQEQLEQQRKPPAIAAPAGGPITSLQQLPQDIRNATAVLEAPNPAAPGGTTRVYVLGASHVSQVSCRQIKELIRAVKPEVRQFSHKLLRACKRIANLLAARVAQVAGMRRCSRCQCTETCSVAGAAAVVTVV